MATIRSERTWTKIEKYKYIYNRYMDLSNKYPDLTKEAIAVRLEISASNLKKIIGKKGIY